MYFDSSLYRGLFQSVFEVLLCKGWVKFCAEECSAAGCTVHAYQLSTNTGDLYILIGDRQTVWYNCAAAAVYS